MRDLRMFFGNLFQDMKVASLEIWLLNSLMLLRSNLLQMSEDLVPIEGTLFSSEQYVTSLFLPSLKNERKPN